MLHVRASVIGLVIVVATLAFGMPGASAQTKMKFAAEDKDLYPTYLGSGTDTLAEKPGVTVELIRLVAKDVGIEPVFVRAPWRRCMELLKEGEVDAVINGSYSSTRAEFGAFPMQGEKPDDARKSHVWTYTLYRKKGSQVSWDGNKFLNVDGPLGTPLGYSIVADLKKMNLEVDESGDGEANLRKLSAGRIAGAVLLREATDPLLKKFADLELQSPVAAKSYFIMLSHQLVKKDPAFAEKFWTRFAEVRASKLAEISAKY
jgi:polar amino acid transport system substrate-binding protein